MSEKKTVAEYLQLAKDRKRRLEDVAKDQSMGYVIRAEAAMELAMMYAGSVTQSEIRYQQRWLSEALDLLRKIGVDH